MRAILIVNPRHDESFVALAAKLVDEGAATPGALQALLRETHPNAVVRARELSGEPPLIWYVYRDGRWTE